MARGSKLWGVACETREIVFFVNHEEIEDELENIPFFMRCCSLLLVHRYDSDEITGLRGLLVGGWTTNTYSNTCSCIPLWVM